MVNSGASDTINLVYAGKITCRRKQVHKKDLVFIKILGTKTEPHEFEIFYSIQKSFQKDKAIQKLNHIT